MKEVTKKAGKTLMNYRPVRAFVLFVIVLYKVLEVIVLAGTSGWLIIRNQDMVSIGVGVALGMWALAKLVSLAYRAEAHKNGEIRSHRETPQLQAAVVK